MHALPLGCQLKVKAGRENKTSSRHQGQVINFNHQSTNKLSIGRNLALKSMVTTANDLKESIDEKKFAKGENEVNV